MLAERYKIDRRVVQPERSHDVVVRATQNVGRFLRGAEHVGQASMFLCDLERSETRNDEDMSAIGHF